MLVSLRCVVVRRCRRDEDLAVLAAAPRYHPPWRRIVLGALSLRLRPGLLGACALFFRRLRGDLHRAHAPGLPPSPDRSWLRARLLVPVSACSHLEVTARANAF